MKIIRGRGKLRWWYDAVYEAWLSGPVDRERDAFFSWWAWTLWHAIEKSESN